MAPVYSSLLLQLIQVVSHLALGVSNHKGNPGSAASCKVTLKQKLTWECSCFKNMKVWSSEDAPGMPGYLRDSCFNNWFPLKIPFYNYFSTTITSTSKGTFQAPLSSAPCLSAAILLSLLSRMWSNPRIEQLAVLVFLGWGAFSILNFHAQTRSKHQMSWLPYRSFQTSVYLRITSRAC